MAALHQTMLQVEGCKLNDTVDLSKFQNVMAALNSLQMYESYFSIFTQNNVDDEALLCLEKDDIKDLIHKIGDRARFMKWLNEYKNGSSNEPLEETKHSKVCTVCNGNKQTKQQEAYTVTVQCQNCNGNGSVSVQRSRPTQTQCTYCDPPGSGKSLKHSECWGPSSMNAGPNGVPWWGTVTQNHEKIYGPNGAETCSFCLAGSPNCSVCKGSAFQTKDEYYSESIVCNVCSGAKTRSETKYKDNWSNCAACSGTGLQM
eukprot:184549_1